MTISLVTGHAGSNHITSAQIGGFQSAYYGHGIVRLPKVSYVDVVVPGENGVNEADGISWPSVTVNGTTATVPAGMWLVNGRLVTIDRPMPVELPSHAAGSGDREDVMNFMFVVNDDGTESIDVGVTEGSSSVNNIAANMLWPNTPQSADVGFAWLEYKSASTTPKVIMVGARHVPLDFVYRRVWSIWGGQLEFVQHGCVCSLFAHKVSKSRNKSWYTQSAGAIIPAWARPMMEHSAPLTVCNNGATTGYIGVYPDGSVQIGNCGGQSSTDQSYGTLTWVVN